MTTSSIVWIVVAVVAAVLLVAAIAWVARKKRTEHRRVQAGDIREKAVEQSHEVGQREALADETAAKARAEKRGRSQDSAIGGPTTPSASTSHRRGYLPRRGEPRIRARRQDGSGLTSQRTPRGDAASRQDPPRMPKTG